MKGYWMTKDFEGRVRSTILLNPSMRDGEMLYHLRMEATDVGVTLDEESIEVGRGGNTILAAGGISSVTVRFTVPYSVLTFDYEQIERARVTP